MTPEFFGRSVGLLDLMLEAAAAAETKGHVSGAPL